MRNKLLTNRSSLICLAAVLVGEAYMVHSAPGDEVALPTIARVLDPGIGLRESPYPTISPDGLWIAYISKGKVCVCNVNEPASRGLLEMPQAPGNFFGFKWTHASNALVSWVNSYDTGTSSSISDIRYVPLEGQVANLAHIESSMDQLVGNQVQIRHDRKFLVSSGYRKALIWDVTTNKPRATPFLNLVASSTSGRWVGIEKDTRQLVITNENFEVVKRFDEFLPARSVGFKLDWSPDERFVILRNQIGFDWYSNWEGFRLDLQTGEKRELEGRFMDEQVAFTRRGGEFFRCGPDGVRSKGFSGDRITGAYFTIVPQGKGPPQDVWRLTLGPKQPSPGMFMGVPGKSPLHMNSDASLFAISIPRIVDNRAGVFWHLINREGKRWKLPGADNGGYTSLYVVAGFADNGKKIVAYDSTRLFTLPVSAIMVDENEAK